MRIANALLLVLSSLAAGCAAMKPDSAAAPLRSDNAQHTLNKVGDSAVQPPVVTPPAQETAPDALVRDLYKQHDADRGLFFQKKDRARVDRYFAKATADLIWKDATDPRTETGALDADPLYNSQDPQPKNFAVGQPKIENDTATVGVSFVNFGAKEVVTYRLVKENSAWKIADIEYKDGRTLLKIFKEDFYRVDEQEQEKSPAVAAGGEFEGRYQVGETTCTVKPVKMAYEVRWAKGSGAMIFFGEEGKRFVSEESGAGSDAFVFDDESLDSGTFIRADGKQVAVRRLK